MATLKFNASGHSKLAQKTTVISSAPPSRPDVSSTDAHLGLLIEHLTFNPRAFIDALVYVANETLYKLGEDFESKAAKLIEERGDVDPEQAAQEAEKVSTLSSMHRQTKRHCSLAHRADCLCRVRTRL